MRMRMKMMLAELLLVHYNQLSNAVGSWREILHLHENEDMEHRQFHSTE